MDTYKIQAKRELIQFEIDGNLKEKTLKPLKNKLLVEIQELGEKSKKLENLKDKINPQTKEVYTDEELTQREKDYNKRIQDIMFKESFEPAFTDEELEETETPTLLEIMERVLILNGLEKMMNFQQRSQAGQPTPIARSPADTLASLNQNPRRLIT